MRSSLFNRFVFFSRHIFVKHSQLKPNHQIAFDRLLAPPSPATVLFKQTIHTTQRQNAIPPLIWVIIAKPITKLAAILTGRGFRKWWVSLPKGERWAILKAHLHRHRFGYGAFVSVSTVGSASYYYAHLQITPITHRQRFILFNNEQLADIAEMGIEDIRTEYKEKIVSLNSPHAERAMRVAKRLFESNSHIDEIKNIHWRLTVIDDETINAGAFPNGEVFVFTGLLHFVKNDDELAIILAHEMSHAILQHAAEELSHRRLIDIFFMALALFIWAALPSDLTAFITQMFVERFRNLIFEYPHSRRQEKEADYVGFLLAARACFDIRQSPDLWKRMKQHEDIPEILSTHPASENRAFDLEKLIPAGLDLRKQCNCHELPIAIPSYSKAA